MTRTFLSRMLLVAGAVVLVACGPRLKPVEYEEPKGSGSGSDSYDDEGSSSSKKKSSSADSDTSSGSSSSSSSGSSSGRSGSFKGCEDKTMPCGSPCTECAPGDMDCMEVLVMKQCNAQHKCVAAPADCSAGDKSDKKKAKKEE